MLVLFAFGVVVSLAAIKRLQRPVTPAQVVDALLAWFVFFNVGVNSLYEFVGYALVGSAYDLASANLGFAVVGFLAAFRNLETRLVAILGAGVFMLGSAYARARDLTAAPNARPDSAWLMFYEDLFIIAVGLV